MIPSRAAICLRPGEPLMVDDISVDPPKDGEVLVEIAATGLCHTDLTALQGSNATCIYPLIPGHEGAGRVVEIGRGVTSLAVGDHVIPLYGPECSACRMCRSGRTNLCWSIKPTRDKGVMPDGTSRFHRRTEILHHFMGTSTFSRYTVLPEIALAKVRKDALLHHVCLFGCGVTTGVGAALGDVKPGDTVAVFGLGGIGINVVQGARLAGARRVIGIDLHAGRRELATSLGMTDFILAEKDARAVEAIRDLTDGGVDIAFECTGLIAVMRRAFDCCAPAWGCCVLLGVEPAGAELSFPPVGVRYGRQIKGSYFGGVKGRSGLASFVDLYMEGKIAIAPLISHELELADINRGFDMMKNGEALRSVIRFEH
jgi:S-(hydroxymethyl)glutathione dehydrogenase/alcohol dehydrogenase